MKDYPLVSIIIPSYNQGRFIEQTLLSILRQDYPEKEVVVIDGGSTDETLDVLRRYPKVKWISEPDRGFADATNKGLKMATGEICAIQSSDDLYLPGVFGMVAEAFRDDQFNLVTGGIVLIDENDNIVGYDVLDVSRFDYACFLRWEYGAIHQSSTFFRRELLGQVGYLNVDMNAGAESDLWRRILKIGPRRIKYINRPLSFYRRHGRQMTSTPGQMLAFAKSFKDSLRLNFSPDDPFYEDALRGASYGSCRFLLRGNLRRELLKELVWILFHRPSFFLDTRFRRLLYSAVGIKGLGRLDFVFRLVFRDRIINVPTHRLPPSAFAKEEFDPKWMYRSNVKSG